MKNRSMTKGPRTEGTSVRPPNGQKADDRFENGEVANLMNGKDGQESVVRVSTNIPGLDEILHGGFIPARAYLVRGGPGCGKTTLGFHFLTAGTDNGEKVLFISMGEPEAQLRKNAAGMGFDLGAVHVLDLSPSAAYFAETESYDIFSPAEVEREPTTHKIVQVVEELKPKRVLLDSMTQFRYLSADAFQFRKQALSFLRYLVDQATTVLFTSEGTTDVPDDDLQFIADGVIHLQSGPEGQTLGVTKFRGSGFERGEHSVRLTEKGMTVYPRLVPLRVRRDFVADPVSSGVPELDELLHGGLERGTVTIVSGPSGAGKTTLGMQFIKEAAGRGEPSVAYSFEEGVQTLLNRCEGISIPVRSMMERGTLTVHQVEPLRYSPDEFAALVRREVEEQRKRIVMIDSITGYGLSMQGRDFNTHLHALTMYLKTVGVTVLLINEMQSITGGFQATDDKVAYLADNIVFLRYLEVNGEMRKAIGVLKKRAGNFEKSLRELEISRYGIKVGPPLTGLRGILSGNPELVETPRRVG